MELTWEQRQAITRRAIARHLAGLNPYTLAVAQIKAMAPEQKAEAEEQAKGRLMPACLVHPRLTAE